MSFRLKTILGIAAIEALLLMLLVWSSLDFLQRSNADQLNKRAVTTAALFASTTKGALIATDLATLHSQVVEVLRNPNVVYARVIRVADGVLAEGGDPTLLRRSFQGDLNLAGVGDGVYDVASEIREGSTVFGRVEIGLSTDALGAVLDQARSRTIGIAALEMLLTALFSLMLGAYLTRQIKGLTEGSRRLAEGELGYQIPVQGRDELAQAASAFNNMSRRLQASYEARTRAEEELRQLTDELECRVRLRTKQLAELNKRLEHQSLHDGLTHLPNRMLFGDRLHQALGGDDGRPGVAVMIIDLDGFKAVNDTLGHHAGDLVLQQVGARLYAQLDASHTLARLGGDEFAVLLPRTDDEAHAWRIARALVDSLADPMLVGEQEVTVGASIGVAFYGRDGEDAAGLLRHADVAMYCAKRAGGGVSGYRKECEQVRPDRAALHNELRTAIEERKLTLHYQPEVDFRSGEVVSVEAFVRWPHPRLGLLQPDDFLPLAEESGLVVPLTLGILRIALQHCAEWRRAGRSHGVTVKVSAHNLQDAEFPQLVAAELGRAGVPPGSLELCVTELAILLDPLRAIENFTALRTLGIRIAVGQFGGSQALSYLKHKLVNKVKISRSFITNILSNDCDSAIVRYTIDLAHSLNLRVCADGVESEAIWDDLKTLGCDGAQGYHLGRPMAAADLSAWMAHGESERGVRARRSGKRSAARASTDGSRVA